MKIITKKGKATVLEESKNSSKCLLEGDEFVVAQEGIFYFSVDIEEGSVIKIDEYEIECKNKLISYPNIIINSGNVQYSILKGVSKELTISENMLRISSKIKLEFKPIKDHKRCVCINIYSK